jgi:hypothetical protein
VQNHFKTCCRISKYNPECRDSAGRYHKEEWISYYDIGKEFAGGILTLDEYLRVEKQYLDTIVDLVRATGETRLNVKELELRDEQRSLIHIPSLQNGFQIEGESLLGVLQDGLREMLWCRLENENISLSFGYDYYIYIETILQEEVVAHLARVHGLHVDVHTCSSE